MRTLKSKGLFASLALSVLFMVGSAATAHANEPDKEKEKKNQPKVEAKTLAPQWFVYSASSHPTNASDAKNQNNYTPVGDPSDLCDGATNLCAILAEPDLSNPSNPRPLITGQQIETEIDNYFSPSSPHDEEMIVQKN